MAKFEAHITCHIGEAKHVQNIGEAAQWKYSEIEGDALLGAKPYCYLTAYDKSASTLLARMKHAVVFLEEGGVQVLRQKIERIIFDTKTNVDEITIHGLDLSD